MRNFLAASLLATEAFLAASNLSCLLLSNKSIFYLLVLKVEHFFCKDYANERNVSLLTDCRAPLIFCKDYASECNESLLSDCRAPLIFCKDTLFFLKMQGIIEKCLRMREIKRKTKKRGHHQHRIIWERALPGLRCKDNNKNGIYQRSFRKITSGRICSYVGTRLLLHRDVSNATSGRNFCCIVGGFSIKSIEKH